MSTKRVSLETTSGWLGTATISGRTPSVTATVTVNVTAGVGAVTVASFAPDATGNIGTEDLVYMLERAGFETGYDLTALIATAKWMSGILGKPPAASVSRAGLFPMAAG